MTGSISSYFVGVKGGLVMSCIAFSIVFLVIIGLMLVMMGTKMLANTIEGNASKAAPKESAPAAGMAPAAAVSAPVAAVAAPQGDDDELIAVISAAIAVVCGGTPRVISFTPAPKHSATTWRITGRLQNAEGFDA